MDILISLDTRRKKQDGTYPIILRISGDNRTLPIATGYSVPQAYWDVKKREIKKNYTKYSSVTRVNSLISQKRNTARNVITTLDENGTLGSLTIHEIKTRIVSVFKKSDAQKVIDQLRSVNIIASDQKQQELLSYLDELVASGELASIPVNQYKSHFTDRTKAGSVFSFIQRLEDDLRAVKNVGYADVHKDLLGFLRGYLGHELLSFNQVDVAFLKALEKWHLSKGNKINSLGTYLRTLRSSFNKAVKEGLADKYASPFGEYSIKKEETDKRNINQDYLERIINLMLTPEDPLFHTRNYFLSSFLMNGMSFIDMAFLTVRNTIQGRVKYQRAKSSRHYNIKIIPMLQTVLDHYIQGKELDTFIFPILKRDTFEEQYLDMETARRQYNRDLKTLAIRCKIQENLSSYVSRHSFAMILKLKGVPLEAISEMLGHSEVRTTKIYLDAFPDEMVDNYAETALDFVNGTGGKAAS